jgi:flavin-dependent dehydrogenase
VLLVGDAAGMVSPLTAGGIHTALKHGSAAGYAIADFLNGKSEDPSGWFTRSYPRFRAKRLLRFLFDHFQSDTLFNLLLGTKLMRSAAGLVYFHHKGVFDPSRRDEFLVHSRSSRKRPLKGPEVVETRLMIFRGRHHVSALVDRRCVRVGFLRRSREQLICR